MRTAPHSRSSYRHFQEITTRWADNDAYGHVNNVVYYSWFDTIVNTLLIRQGALDVERSPVIGLVIESHCHYFAPLAFPQIIEAGLRVATIGNASVRYDIALFASGESIAAAQGYLVHVMVDRATRQSTPIPAPMRILLQNLMETAT
jgi:acyl-CoA thioester hydrolase